MTALGIAAIVAIAVVVCVALLSEQRSQRECDERFSGLSDAPLWTWSETRTEQPPQPPASPAIRR